MTKPVIKKKLTEYGGIWKPDNVEVEVIIKFNT